MVLCMLHKPGFRAIYSTKCSQLSMVAPYLVKWGAICVGVPHAQGLILYRPFNLLFSIYINDLPTVVKYSIFSTALLWH